MTDAGSLLSNDKAIHRQIRRPQSTLPTISFSMKKVWRRRKGVLTSRVLSLSEVGSQFGEVLDGA